MKKTILTGLAAMVAVMAFTASQASACDTTVYWGTEGQKTPEAQGSKLEKVPGYCWQAMKDHLKNSYFSPPSTGVNSDDDWETSQTGWVLQDVIPMVSNGSTQTYTLKLRETQCYQEETNRFQNRVISVRTTLENSVCKVQTLPK